MVTQRAESGAARAIGVTQRPPNTGPGARLADLDPEAPRRGTPLWVPMLIVLVVAGLAASAVWWVWGRGHLATSDEAAEAGAQGEPQTVAPAALDADPSLAVDDDTGDHAPANATDDAERAADTGAAAPDDTEGEADGGGAKADAEVGAEAGDPPPGVDTAAPAEGGDDATAADAEPTTDTKPEAEPETQPETKPKPRPKKPKKRPRRETPEPEPQLPGFWPGPVPP